ncbi:MAG: DUF5615 family PIN-like protein [bacterium]
MARLYANENFPLPVVEELRRLGHEVITIYETGKAGQSIPDEDVLTFARDENRILVTVQDIATESQRTQREYITTNEHE